MTSTEMNEMHPSAPPTEASRADARVARAAGAGGTGGVGGVGGVGGAGGHPSPVRRIAPAPAMSDAWAEARSRDLKRSPYPRLVGKVLRRTAFFNVAAWDRALGEVRRTQELQLRELVAHAKDTEFGKKHGFARIRTYEDFAHQVPLGDYDSFSPYIERMRRGERNLLVPEFVRYFGNSSGSSNHGRPKFLPITERQIVHTQRAGTDTVMRYLHWSGDEGMLGGGYTLGLFPPITMREEGPVLITSNPALMNTRMPAIARIRVFISAGL